MSSPKASGDTGTSGNNQTAQPQAASVQQPSNPAGTKRTNYWVHLLAIIPILVAFGIYNLPTIIDEYGAIFG